MIVGAGAGVSIGTTAPVSALDVKGDVHASGGLRFGTTASAPTCSATNRGEFWFTQGGTGVKDLAQVCAKDASDAYAWRVVY